MTKTATSASTTAPVTSLQSGSTTAKKSGESGSVASRRRRESTWDKALRLLAEGKVRVTFVSEAGYLVHATVQGDHGSYFVDHGLSREGRWTCSCPAYMTDCSHARAVQQVTVQR